MIEETYRRYERDRCDVDSADRGESEAEAVEAENVAVISSCSYNWYWFSEE